MSSSLAWRAACPPPKPARPALPRESLTRAGPAAAPWNAGPAAAKKAHDNLNSRNKRPICSNRPRIDMPPPRPPNSPLPNNRPNSPAPIKPPRRPRPNPPEKKPPEERPIGRQTAGRGHRPLEWRGALRRKRRRRRRAKGAGAAVAKRKAAAKRARRHRRQSPGQAPRQGPKSRYCGETPWNNPIAEHAGTPSCPLPGYMGVQEPPADKRKGNARGEENSNGSWTQRPRRKPRFPSLWNVF